MSPAPFKNEYTDPKTGEKVTKVAIPEFHQKDIEAGMQAHQQNMNQFLMFSQQYFFMLINCVEGRKALDVSDKVIKERLQFACKKVGISPQDPWNYNMIEKVFEMREPPLVVPVSNNLLGGYETITQPTEPTIGK